MTEQRGPGLNFVFNAQQFAPNQDGGGGTHPIGKHPATITDTEVRENSKKTGHIFDVEFTTPNGKTRKTYNIVNPSQESVRIGLEQLSALSHATGIFNLDMNNHGAVLRGGRCMIEVSLQTSEEARSKGWTEISHVYDANGNEPGKAPTQGQPFQAPGGFNPNPQQPQPMPQQFAQQPQQTAPVQQQQPQTQQGWPQQQQTPQVDPNAGWGQPQQQQQPNPQQQQQPPMQQQQAPAQQWQPQPNAAPNQAPPGWGNPNGQ